VIIYKAIIRNERLFYMIQFKIRIIINYFLQLTMIYFIQIISGYIKSTDLK